MKHLILAFYIFLFTLLRVSGQTDTGVRSTDSGDLSLRIRNISFFKNNEYYSPVIEGYTLVGYFVQPALVYSPNNKLSLTAGVHLLKYAGKNGYTNAKPVFTATYNFSEKTSLTMGTLRGSDSHNMYDPHFDTEKAYNAYSEDGIQFVSSGKNFFNDTWINWEHFIFKGDTAREIFTFGQSFRYFSPEFAGAFSIELPLQVQARHLGGQISNYEESVETHINLSSGLRLNYNVAGGRSGTFGLEYQRFNYSQVPDRLTGLKKGFADWYRLHYKYKFLSVSESYWKSHDFYAPNGNKIYSSISDYQDGVIVHDRKILTTSVYLTTFPVDCLELYFGIDLYYDIIRKRVDNSLALHLRVDKMIHLMKVK